MLGVLQVSDDHFETKVLKSKVPVLVDFWAEWCGPCRMLSPILDELAKDMGEKILVAKVNIDENPESPSRFGVTSIPTMILFKDGKAVSMKAGLMQKNALKEWIESLL